MGVANAPPKLFWIARRAIGRIPLIREYYGRRQVERTYELAKKAAKREFPFKVLTSGWATQDRLSDESYKSITSELAEIDKMVGPTQTGSMTQALHWSRRYEYPYAIMNMGASDSSKGLKILDCGSGTGPLQFYLAMNGYNVYSLDLDLRALEKVAKFKSTNNLETLYPAYGNILDLPFPDGYFDRVFSISVLEHVVYLLKEDTTVILKGFVNELLRVLKPGGLVVLTFDVNMSPQKSAHRLYYSEYESLCGILGIPPEPVPENRLYSSDTGEGRMMGEDLCVYCAVLERR
jgi:SAM-dependent methyltransferase